MADFNQLYEEFLKIADSGDEAAAQKFLSDHLAEFPENVQEELIFAFMKDAYIKRGQAIEENAQLQQQGLKAIEEMVAEKKVIEEEGKIGEIKEGLGIKIDESES